MKAFLFAVLLSSAAISARAESILDKIGPGSAAGREAQACNALQIQTSGPAKAPFKRLGDLPPGFLQHAVLRTVEGCPVLEVVMHGQIYYAPSIPPVSVDLIL